MRKGHPLLVLWCSIDSQNEASFDVLRSIEMFEGYRYAVCSLSRCKDS